MIEIVVFVFACGLTALAVLSLQGGQRSRAVDEPPTLDTRNHLDD